MISFGMFFWVIVRLFPGPIAMIFGVTDELLVFTAHALQIQLFMVPVMGLQMLSANFFQSTGQPLKSLALSLSRQVLFMVPLIIILPIVMPMLFPQVFIGLDGIIYSYPLADLLSVGTATLMMRSEFKRIDKKIAAQTAATG
jgi:Na+-driven multidrug efflux pump